ncbi:MAG: tetraacyldisaccharide 4'-kinase [Nitrospirae bacterium]|nr:tetraacyldisaccharide 4'-kinase [Nitrospirota bacterium]
MIPFEFLYHLGYSIKKRYALRNQKRLPHKVISIGNITVGGTGKTPATIALAKEAKKRGFKPCILTRGYKGKVKDPCFVFANSSLITRHSSLFYGDEPVLMAERLQDVPIVKCADRYKGGVFALSSLHSALCPDLFILDDGFQHWGLFRDKDILLIDGTNPFGNRRLLPFGPLREPISAINRAVIIAITKLPLTHPSPSRGKGKGGGGLIEEIRQYNSKAPIFFAEHRPLKFTTATGDVMPPEWAKEKRLFGFCGIGSPESFRETLLSADVELIGFKTYRDHYRYTLGDIQVITRDAEQSGAEWIVTTEKDIMRLRGLDVSENFVALSIEFAVDEGFYEEVFNF